MPEAIPIASDSIERLGHPVHRALALFATGVTIRRSSTKDFWVGFWVAHFAPPCPNSFPIVRSGSFYWTWTRTWPYWTWIPPFLSDFCPASNVESSVASSVEVPCTFPGGLFSSLVHFFPRNSWIFPASPKAIWQPCRATLRVLALRKWLSCVVQRTTTAGRGTSGPFS